MKKTVKITSKFGFAHILLFLVISITLTTAVLVFYVARKNSISEAICVFNCGEPRDFCTSVWAGKGGFCDDYLSKDSGDVHVLFPAAGDPYSFDAFGSTQTGYETKEGNTMITDEGRRAVSQNEHFHTIIYDETFGVGILRLHQPVDFTGREAHFHFEVDLKTSSRRYLRFMVSPALTKSATDDRDANGLRRPSPAFETWFVDGTFQGKVYKNSQEVGGFSETWPRYYGTENVRDKVDVYLSRTHARIIVNGTEFVNSNIPDLGFDKGYVYLTQASYNPCKDGQCSVAEQTFHWDNVAFDGPVLPLNGLTPSGQRDIVFNAFSAQSCKVKGVSASRVGDYRWGTWITWTARFNDDGSSVGTNDISCSYDFSQNGSEVPRGLEIVKPYTREGTPPTAPSSAPIATPTSTPTPTLPPGCTLNKSSVLQGGPIIISGANGLSGTIGMQGTVGTPTYSTLGTLPPNGTATINVPTNAQPGSYVVRVGGLGVACTPNITVNAVPSPTPTPTPQPQTGQFKAEFFNNKTLSGTPVATINTTTINYNWRQNSPLAGVNSDNFSVRFTGNFNFDGSSYRFNATGDDGIRVKVDGQTVINGWKDQSATSYNVLRTLSGQHAVVVEFYDNWVDAVARANWVHALTCFDMTGDGLIDNSDLDIIAAHQGATGVTPWDVNGNKRVNVVDLSLTSKKLGTSCN